MAESQTADEWRRSDRGPQARGKPDADDHAGPQDADDAGASEPKKSKSKQGDDADDKSDEKSDDKAGKQEGDDGKSDDEPAKPSPLKKTWVRVAIAVVVILLLVAGGIWLYHYWTHGRFVQNTNNAYLQADQVTISARVSGTVMEVYVGDNQQVHAGDRLARIDDRTYRDRVQQALAQAAQARATVAQYEAQIGEQRATIAQAQAAIDGAESQRRYNQGEVDRYLPLVLTGAEPAQQLAQRVASRDQALATLRQDRASALQARRRVTTLSAQMATARAQVAAAEAQAREAQIDVESSLVTASIDGRVGDRQVRVGMEAQVGTRLLTLVPVQSIYLVANFKETQIGLMRVGQPATIKVDALDGTELSGTVDSFSPATGAAFALIPANNATGNFTKIVQRVPVRIRIDANEEERKVLVPGLSVEVSVDTLGSRDDSTRLKQDAKSDKPRREQQSEEGVTRDRQQAASGAGQ